MKRRHWTTWIAALGAALSPASLAAQDRPPLAVWGEAQVGSELESYLRLLQVTGRAPLYPWSVRGLSLREVEHLGPVSDHHPWAGRYDFAPARGPGRWQVRLLRPSLATTYNSAFAFGGNDGPVWAGKGLTTAVQAGVAARYGPASLIIQPVAFRAENVWFPLMPNGQTGERVYADGRFPTRIDQPQRFGDAPYQRLDPGQSTFRVDLPGVALGVSTANQWWGPAGDYPVVLGNNAAGFRHAFLGTSAPLDLWLFKAHGRLMWGELSQTAYSPAPDSLSRRFTTGVVGVITPRGVPGLELGAGRFFHVPWPAGGLRLRDFAKPFESVLKVDLPDTTIDPNNPRQSADNQLASVFGRWVFPDARFEVYGEFGREDHNWDLRDLALEPDHSSAYMLGLRKVWTPSRDVFLALNAEVFDARASHLLRGRPGSPDWYTHAFTPQGHTQSGQLLGAAPGAEGAGAVIRLSRYQRAGRWTFTWRREVRQANGRYWQTGVFDPKSLDVLHTVGGEALLFRGPLDITAGLAGTYEFNRSFGGDEFNLNASLRVRSAIPWTRPPAVERRAMAPPAPTGGADQAPSRFTFHGSRSPEPFFTGDPSEDRARLDQLQGARGTAGFLIRSLSRQWDGDSIRQALGWSALGPMAQTVWNSGTPLSLNDGALWAGRGANARLVAGVRLAWGPVSLVVAPQVVYSQNREFEPPDPRIAPAMPPERSPFASPWHVSPGSIDQPLRFGDSGFTRLDPGQSALTFRAAGFAAGIATEDQWWGPGIRNAIVMSNNAPGFPHVFLRTARPLGTAAGSFEAKWLVGGLSESRYFDNDSTNNLRSLSAMALTWTAPFEPGLTLGLARAVYAPADGWGQALTRWLKVFTDPGRPNDHPPSDTSRAPGPDQVYSLFGRWVLPGLGFEVYGEWSRTELPASLRDLLVQPDHTRGFTLGLQWATPAGRADASLVRLQGEITYLEEGPSFRDRPQESYYASRAVIQGYTNRGQVIGAAVGPGGSGQWLAVDYLAPRWRVGLFGNRIRWENDALYRMPEGAPGNHYCMHDVSIFGGLRAGYDAPLGRIAASLSTGTRMNVHFQNFTYCSNPDGSLRTYIPNRRLELTVTRSW
jgi:hypothetical protein